MGAAAAWPGNLFQSLKATSGKKVFLDSVLQPRAGRSLSTVGWYFREFSARFRRRRGEKRPAADLKRTAGRRSRFYAPAATKPSPRGAGSPWAPECSADFKLPDISTPGTSQPGGRAESSQEAIDGKRGRAIRDDRQTKKPPSRQSEGAKLWSSPR